MAPPVLLLDIDGVLNAISPDPPDTFPADQWQRFHATDPAGGSWRMQIATPVVNWLRKLHVDGVVEVRWHTTWQAGALDIGDQVGLPTFRVADAPENNWNPIEMRRQWWKFPAAARVVQEEGRRLIWVDDDIDDFLHPRDQAVLNGRTALICPKTRTGLMPRNMGQIEYVINRWEREDAASTDPSGEPASSASSAASAEA